jgi:hypothetical protein
MPIINVTDEVWRRLTRLADARNTNIDGVLGEAIGLEEMYVMAANVGGRMLIERQGGSIEEVVLPSHDSKRSLAWDV